MATTRRDNGKDTDPRTIPEELNPRRLLLRLLALAVFIALVATAVGSLPGLGTLRHRFAQVSPLLLALIAALKLGSCLSNVVAFRDVFCPRMRWGFSYKLAMAEQGTNVLVPTGGAGGLALGAWALRQGGMSTEHIARRSVAFFVLTSLPNFACAGVLGPVLLTGVFGRVPEIPTVVFSALAWVIALMIAGLPLVLGRIDPDKGAGTILGKLRSSALLLGRGISDTGMLLRTRRWPAILGAAGYLGFDIAALVVGFAAFGGGVPLAPIVFGYVIGQLGGLLPLPAGVGGTDGGLIGALVLYGSSVAQAAAAVLAYRAFQLSVPAVLGVVAFIQLRRTLADSRAPGEECLDLANDRPGPQAASA